MAYPAMASSRYPVENHTPLAKHFRGITINERFNNAEGGHFSEANFSSVLFKARTDSYDHVKMEVWHAPGRSKPTFEEAKRKHYKPLKKDERFGPSWTNHWVRIHLSVPKELQREERVQLEFDPGCEAMVFNTDGLPLQGITGGYRTERRVEFIIKDPSYAQSYYIEVSANGLFGTGEDDMTGPSDNRYFTLDSADIVVPRMEAWHLLWDFRVLKDLARSLPAESRLGNKAMYAANEMMNVFRSEDLSTITKARKIAEGVFGKGWQEKGAEIFEEGGGEPIWAMSNCHIDTAWLWPFSVTQQKTARSWSTQCDLLERYPEHRFVASQAQQFKWLEQQYPSLFDVIKGKVEAGTFMPIGGSWVENDTNLPTGESLCRQMIFGQRYFKSRFGKYCDVHWLPDTFGYSSQLPQICRLANMPSFFTQKLSWSQFNNFPHTTFNWVGLDGTQVLTHMTPVNTYNAKATVEDALNGVKQHKNLEVTDISLLPFGNGDGGGGALAPMIESLRRLRAVANENAELPKIGYGKGKSVSDMYQAILKQTRDGSKLPTWIGELYLEYHRGTYTSHGSIKKNNRKCEILLKELEYLSTLASIQAVANNSSYRYPKGEIDPLWEKLLLCQFHDVLPGSALGMVYDDAEEMYAEIKEKGNALMQEAVKALLPDSCNISRDERDTPFALNTSTFPRREIVALPHHLASPPKDRLSSQVHGEETLVLMEDKTGSGVATTLESADWEPVTCYLSQGSWILANETLEVKIAADTGRLTSIVDLRERRQLISPGRTGGFVMFQDIPAKFDAWDVDVWHLETAEQLNATSVSLHMSGPLRGAVVLEYKYGKSSWKTIISLDAVAADADALSMLRFDTTVQWQEKHKFLKWEVPLEIFSSQAFYETQYGYISRPTHRNTSWDAAKFEVCGHKYIDLSEFGYGVAMLNDCKYGFAVAGNTMRISLLRSATGPDPHQDEGQHQFQFALVPHRHHFYQTQVTQLAAAFNMPLRVQFAPQDALQASMTDVRGPFRVAGAPNVILDTVKRSDDDDFISSKGSQSVICRLYESKGGHATASLITTLPVVKATIVDLLERHMEDLELVSSKDSDNTTIQIPFRGFQIVTVKLELGKAKDSAWIEV